MTAAPGRRAVLLAPLLPLVAGGCGRNAPGAAPVTSSSTKVALVPALQLKDRMLGGVGVATGQISIRRPRTDSGRLGWTAGGAVRYGPDGLGTALLDVASDSGKVRLVVRQDAMFLRRAGTWRRIDLERAAVDTLALLTEIRRAVPLIGQTAFVPGAVFRSGAAAPDGEQLWSAAVSREELSTVWPAGVLDRYDGLLTTMDVLLTLDADDRPVRRIDTARPNSVQLTTETSWSDWGVPVTIPTPDIG